MILCNQISIAFDIFKSFNQRQNLITQFKYINKNDILTADRWVIIQLILLINLFY